MHSPHGSKFGMGRLPDFPAEVCGKYQLEFKGENGNWSVWGSIDRITSTVKATTHLCIQRSLLASLKPLMLMQRLRRRSRNSRLKSIRSGFLLCVGRDRFARRRGAIDSSLVPLYAGGAAMAQKSNRLHGIQPVPVAGRSGNGRNDGFARRAMV